MEYNTATALREGHFQLPDWIQTSSMIKKKNLYGDMLLCNDREHLMFYVEMGCFEFHAYHAQVKSFESPDYMIIGLEGTEEAFEMTIDAARITRTILSALLLPSFIKTDGISGLHIYIPLDAKSDFQTCRNAAEFICKLIRLKVPDLVALKGSEGRHYGKVLLAYDINDGRTSLIAPYSLVTKASATIAAPLLWDEVKKGLNPKDWNYETITARLKQTGDPFEKLFNKKVNAGALLERMQNNYSFLF